MYFFFFLRRVQFTKCSCLNVNVACWLFTWCCCCFCTSSLPAGGFLDAAAVSTLLLVCLYSFGPSNRVCYENIVLIDSSNRKTRFTATACLPSSHTYMFLVVNKLALCFTSLYIFPDADIPGAAIHFFLVTWLVSFHYCQMFTLYLHPLL